MVDTSLNKKYEAREGKELNFSPIPAGEYTVRVKEISKWDEVIKNIKLILKDENGNAILNEKGEKETEIVNDCKFYNCNVKFEVVGGQYDGRILFYNLTTHPNMSFQIPAFLYAIKLQELAASEIQSKTVGKMCVAKVDIEPYDKKVQDKDTGLDTIEKKEKNTIKNLKQLISTTPNNDLNDNNLGI